MGYLDAVTRVSQIDTMLQQLTDPAAGATSSSAGASTAPSAATSGSNSSFQSALASAQTDPAAAVGGSADSSNPGLRALAIAKTQLGVTEQPPGSNDGPQISMYRSAVAGSYTGAPWCAYFVSWCAKQAGAPLGSDGQGLGSVAEITDWAKSTGRFTETPQPGDLILFGTEHVGIVESVNPDGTLTTVEGNTSNGVYERQHLPSEATGYVRLG
jgi:cell wall-associated NlpC family hydrolase